MTIDTGVRPAAVEDPGRTRRFPQEA